MSYGVALLIVLGFTAACVAGFFIIGYARWKVIEEPILEMKEKQMSCESERRQSESDALREKIVEWRPIGSSFVYLGREVIVTGNGCPSIPPGPYWYGKKAEIELKCDYVDDAGVIRSVTLDQDAVVALYEQSKKPECKCKPVTKRK